MTLGELLKVINKSKSVYQHIKLFVRHHYKGEDTINSVIIYEGDSEDESFLNEIKKFLECEVKNITSEVIKEKSSLRITIDYDKYIPFTLNESNIEEYSDAFYKYE